MRHGESENARTNRNMLSEPEADSLPVRHWDRMLDRKADVLDELMDGFRQFKEFKKQPDGRQVTRSCRAASAPFNPRMKPGCTASPSYDERQRKCAALSGLKVVPSKIGKVKRL